MAGTILSIQASQRLDSRGKPTVQVRVQTKDGAFTSIVPSGASKGDYEAVELRDNDERSYQGNGVLKAVHNVETILGPAIVGAALDPATQLDAIDRLMIKLDGTEDKSKLGANAILGVSMAAARAGAARAQMPLYRFLAKQAGSQTEATVLPVPFMNVLNGGEHSGNSMAFQEFMIAPTGAASFAEAVRLGSETYACLKALVVNKYGKSSTGIGDEGGFAPPISHPTEALDLLEQAIADAGHEGKIKIGIDSASQSFEENGIYNTGYKTGNPRKLNGAELAKVYHGILARYPVVLLEDPFGQDDWRAWEAFNKECTIELVGDDLLATNIKRIEMAESKKACNSLLLKINQIGTITEAIEAARKAFSIGWTVFVSHRSGETTDDFIADLTVALQTGHIKSGAPCRGERVVKYNRLMDIEDDLRSSGMSPTYSGEGFRCA